MKVACHAAHTMTQKNKSMSIEQQFEKLLTRYETAFFELNDYETRVLPELKNGKVVNCLTVVTLEEFESTIGFMEELIKQERSETKEGQMIYQEEGRSFFNWLTLAHFVRLIKDMVKV